METTKQSYQSFSWDTDDLLQCKNTVIAMIILGISEEVILSLYFGNLDVTDVIDNI